MKHILNYTIQEKVSSINRENKSRKFHERDEVLDSHCMCPIKRGINGLQV
jgi:hypothetical protein